MRTERASGSTAQRGPYHPERRTRISDKIRFRKPTVGLAAILLSLDLPEENFSVAPLTYVATSKGPYIELVMFTFRGINRAEALGMIDVNIARAKEIVDKYDSEPRPALTAGEAAYMRKFQETRARIIAGGRRSMEQGNLVILPSQSRALQLIIPTE